MYALALIVLGFELGVLAVVGGDIAADRRQARRERRQLNTARENR